MNYLSDEDYLAVCHYELRKAQNRLLALGRDDVSPERAQLYARVKECQKSYDEARALITKNTK